jgi:pyruvate/2-oxoglutarate dehydrogenase complex dihydrolipoamide acyltransferase (E2) component
VSYYFVPVPALPPEVHHQDGMVRVVSNLVCEGEGVVAGTPLIEVENWWATMRILATGPGRISKIFFGAGTYVRLNDPFAIVVCDPEDGRSGHEASTVQVIRLLRTKSDSKDVAKRRDGAA